MPETTLIIVVVLGNLKLIAIANNKLIVVNKKQPKLNSVLFSKL
ncbi:hypothetical protein SAMN04488104_1002178 [Algoriphagus faecimaris]|uniref:Uncharacterized protein n=1 Tax=Algoriphagus faecimaris TaxID=686796 RepID=A0A1G6N118_9BACT|nr:hypothetical protein SAMN04488104_1002178 [Algoriphagus faecimaris]